VQYNRSYFYAQSVAEFAEALGYKNQSVVPVAPTKASAKETKSEVKSETKSPEPVKAKPKKSTAKKKVRQT
jgi:membrane-bound lytic murein transglycosylase B